MNSLVFRQESVYLDEILEKATNLYTILDALFPYVVRIIFKKTYEVIIGVEQINYFAWNTFF